MRAKSIENAGSNDEEAGSNFKVPLVYTGQHTFTTTAAAQSFTFSLGSDSFQSGLICVSYRGSNKEYIAMVPYVIRAFNVGYGAKTAEVSFNGVALALTSPAGNTVSLDFSNGVSGATIQVKVLRLL